MDEQELDRATRVPKHIRRQRDDTDMLIRALDVAEQYKAKLETATKELAEAKEVNNAVVEAIERLSDSIDPRCIKRLMDATKGGVW